MAWSKSHARPAGAIKGTAAAVDVDNGAAIVLLAGGYEERAPVAASLYRAGAGAKILLTDDGVRRGWSVEHRRNLFAIERTEIELVKLRVPQTLIVRLPFLKSGTIYDALAVRDYVAGEGVSRLVLVTSDYHARRALWTFQRTLRNLPVTVTVVPAPSSGSFLSHRLSEYLKMSYYIIRFGLLTDAS